MGTSRLRVSSDAEQRLRATIAKEFRRVASGYGTEQAAADALGISRQRFKQYLDKKMTPKADVLLVAMATWGLKILYEGITFSAKVPRPIQSEVPEQLTLDYFDEPQVLRDDKNNLELKVSRKQNDRLRFAVEIRLAG